MPPAITKGAFLWRDVPGLDEAFRKAVANRWSASKIAEELSAAFNIVLTRNAVIGRAHRQQLQLRGGPSIKRTGAKKVRQTVAKSSPPSIAPIMLEMFDKAPAKPAEPAKRGVTFAKLTDDMCRWIEGEPSAIAPCYCGGERLKNIVGKQRNPYCLEHSYRAYGPGEIVYTTEQIAEFKRKGHMKTLARAR